MSKWWSHVGQKSTGAESDCRDESVPPSPLYLSIWQLHSDEVRRRDIICMGEHSPLYLHNCIVGGGLVLKQENKFLSLVSSKRVGESEIKVYDHDYWISAAAGVFRTVGQGAKMVMTVRLSRQQREQKSQQATLCLQKEGELVRFMHL